MSSVFLFARFIDPPAKDQVRLAGEEIMGYEMRIACRTAFVDDVIVFAIFIAVCSPPQRSSPFLDGSYRTGTCRRDISSGICTVSGITTVYTCHTRSSFSNPGVASYSATFHQRVSDVVN